MTSTAKQDLYQHANDLNCTLRDVRSSGRNWQGAVRDALHPTRPEMGFGMHDFERCKNQITAYCDRRQGWVQANQGALNSGHTLFGMLDDATQAASSAVQILEVPGGFTQDDLDAAVNDAIQELMQNMGTLQPTTHPELLDSTTAGMVPATKLADLENKLRHTQNLWNTDLTRLASDINALRESNKLLGDGIQKRDAVILTLREDFTRLLAESQARNVRLYGLYDEIASRSQEHIRNIVTETKKKLTSGADLAERRTIDDRVKGCLERVNTTLAASGLVTDGKTITPLKEAE